MKTESNFMQDSILCSFRRTEALEQKHFVFTMLIKEFIYGSLEF